MEFAELDAEIARLTRCLILCAESPEFADLGAEVERRIATEMLPVLVELLCLTDGEQRAEVARRYDDLLDLLPGTVACANPAAPFQKQ